MREFYVVQTMRNANGKAIRCSDFMFANQFRAFRFAKQLLRKGPPEPGHAHRVQVFRRGRELRSWEINVGGNHGTQGHDV